MSHGFSDRLNNRRKKGPSYFEKQRGPNTGAWEKTTFSIRRRTGIERGISDPDRFVNSRKRNIQQ